MYIRKGVQARRRLEEEAEQRSSKAASRGNQRSRGTQTSKAVLYAVSERVSKRTSIYAPGSLKRPDWLEESYETLPCIYMPHEDPPDAEKVTREEEGRERKGASHSANRECKLYPT